MGSNGLLWRYSVAKKKTKKKRLEKYTWEDGELRKIGTFDIDKIKKPKRKNE